MVVWKIGGFLAAFAVAIWSLAAAWATFRATWEAPSSAGVAATVAYFAVFLGSFLLLGFWLYAADRAAGRIQRRIGLYERFLHRGK